MEKQAADYVKEIRKAARTGVAVPIPLETDDRVLARITDGIYRQPASAIRELIANAYDADATEVVVMTDAPRYSEILVRDNGNGMTAEVLVNLIQHIGGSAKRTHVGQGNGVTHPDDPRLSPGERRLIGKIGIGLFSVSQLTRQFTIITKPKKENYRYTAVVTLHHYTDETLGHATNETKFNTGETVITTEEVDGDESHGTTILLGSLIPRARKVLQSREMWSALRNKDPQTVGVVRRVVPAIHSGLVSDGDEDFEEKPQVPWTSKTPAQKRMELLSTRLIEVANKNDLYAQVDNAFDYYFRMVWSLGLALPLPYIDEHPFDLPGGTKTRCFLLSNKSRSAPGAAGENQATELDTDAGKNVGKVAELRVPREGKDFRVEFDGLRLFRPIRYDIVQASSRALQTPLLFVGGFKPDLTKFDKTQRGGEDLEFSGYFYWTTKVVPKEHTGLLVRIIGASGTLFDTTFLNYQIQEKPRLAHLVAEVFVSAGLEEALNIDRESFNTAHPHYQILLNWVHNALRQVFNKQKEIEKSLRTKRRQQTGTANMSAVQKTREDELHKVLGDDDDVVSDVVFTDDDKQQMKAKKEGKRVFPFQSVIAEPVAPPNARNNDNVQQRNSLNQERAIGLVQLLDAYDLLDHITPDQQSQLVAAIFRIFNSGE